MLLGYNQERPTEKNYRDFEKKLVRGLSELDQEGLSLMFYGSFTRGDYNPGRSDIDGIITFSDDVVINKKNLGLVGKVLHHSQEGNNVPFQVSVMDISTMRDGRFNTYDESFSIPFKEEGLILVGPDYREEYSYELPTMSEQIQVRFNLRKSRTGLLFAEHDIKTDYETFLKKFLKTLDSVSGASKQIVRFSDGVSRKNRFVAETVLEEIFPEIDIEPLLRIKELYNDSTKLDSLYQQPEEIMNLWNSSVTFYEEMVREYIKKHPKRQSE